MSEKILEAAVLDALAERLMQPELCAVFCKEYTSHLNSLRRDENASRQRATSDLAQTERQIARLIEAIKNGVDAALIKDEINQAQERKLMLQGMLASVAKAPVFVHPKMAERYQAAIQELLRSLKEPESYDAAAEMVRSLIEKIVLTPNAERSDLVIDLYGDLAGILRIAAMQDRQRKRVAVAAADEACELAQAAVLTGGSGDYDISKQPEGSENRYWRLRAAPANRILMIRS